MSYRWAKVIGARNNKQTIAVMDVIADARTVIRRDSGMDKLSREFGLGIRRATNCNTRC
jgi:hypothetical protein